MEVGQTYRYQVGGSLSHGDPTYVERAADTSLYQQLRAGELCYVFNARQMGKSSLLVQTKHRLETEGILCIALDLTVIGGATATPQQWYKGLLLQLCMGCKILGQFNFKQWWLSQEDLPFIQRFNQFVEEILWTHFPDQKIVIFLDEIDAVMSLSFPTDELFALIRFCFNQRSLDPRYHYLTFALFGVANPSTLIQNPHLTPFNVGCPIELQGFSEQEIYPLSRGLGLPQKQATCFLKAIFQWTSGQPFLTQKIAKVLAESVAELFLEIKDLEIQEIDHWVGRKIHDHIIQDWESNDQPEHLTTISKRILHNESTAGRLLGIYQAILLGQTIHYDHSREHMELLLSGLVVNRQGQLRVKNQIYQSVFDLDWIAQHLDNLRPYSAQLQAWLASQERDEQNLLMGVALEQALAWSQEKQLSDLDYRFLAASQALATREVEHELGLERQERELAELTSRSLQAAVQAFSDARQRAQEKSRSLQLGRRWLLGISGGVSGGVICLRALGLLQGIEWLALDQLFNHRIGQTLDPRITLVTIDEPDIQAVGTYPLPDRILAQALENLSRYQPRAIGLDIYRDLPIQPGHAELTEILARSPHIIGIEKVVPPVVLPPPVLQQTEQVGFVDQITDGDGTIRRTLLSMNTQDGEGIHLSFSLQLALKYLSDEGIKPEFLEKSRIQWGETVISPFDSQVSGFYVGAESAGYQILLNYYGPQSQFQTLPLQSVLRGDFDSDWVRDRVVLIGFTADSVNDFFPSPYGNRLMGSAELIAGVTVHANHLSQLLNAALEGRPLLRVWPQSVEWFWILGWSLLASGLVWPMRSSMGKIGITILLALLLSSIAVFAFAGGWWIPLIPALMSLNGSAILLSLLTTKQSEHWRLYYLTHQLRQLAQEQPVVGQVALDYLRQIEGQEPAKRKLIENWLDRHRE